VTTHRPHSYEHRFRWISLGLVGLFALAFAAGLVLYVVEPAGPRAVIALHAGLVLLMASPAVRMAIATADRLRRRDYAFIGMTLIVVVELAIVFWRADR
jgi:hypothetical protein